MALGFSPSTSVALFNLQRVCSRTQQTLAQAMTKHGVLEGVFLAPSDALIFVPPALLWLLSHLGKPSIFRGFFSSGLPRNQYFLRILAYCFINDKLAAKFELNCKTEVQSS